MKMCIRDSSVTPCWCYGFETIEMDGEMPKAIWGFNGTERPGAVYLASALASHTQKGLPTFGIYGRDVQEVTNMEIPEDVQEKLLRFARAGIAVATMKGKSYLSIGSVSMGIAGSIPNPDFFQEYLGMRNEYVDASEIERRVQLGIYDHEEFARAMAWTEKYCKSNEGTDFKPEHLVYSREEKDARWEYVVKMTLIFRDMMIGNPKLAEMGFKEESMGHNAIAAGFQGQRQWTDYKPDGDFSEAILNTSFDWNGIREAFTFATENDTLNCTSMLFNHLLTNTAQLLSLIPISFMLRSSTFSPKMAVTSSSLCELLVANTNFFLILCSPYTCEMCIRDRYIAFCNYKGKRHAMLLKRRKAEFALFYIP